MPGLVPGIHVFLSHFIESPEDVDGRDKPGHDESIVSSTHRLRLWRGRHLSREKIQACKKSSEIINLKN
ncbi:MAG TPA: hypothetical protein VN838_20235 [Bradyrhizobium sp.]|nr:hypothetical protein [Bradyrhizobium sp.]